MTTQKNLYLFYNQIKNNFSFSLLSSSTSLLLLFHLVVYSFFLPPGCKFKKSPQNYNDLWGCWSRSAKFAPTTGGIPSCRFRDSFPVLCHCVSDPYTSSAPTPEPEQSLPAERGFCRRLLLREWTIVSSSRNNTRRRRSMWRWRSIIFLEPRRPVISSQTNKHQLCSGTIQRNGVKRNKLNDV